MASYEEILQQFKRDKVIPSGDTEDSAGDEQLAETLAASSSNRDGKSNHKNKVSAHAFATLVKDIQLLKQNVSLLHDAAVTKDVKSLEEEVASLRDELMMLKRTMALQQEDMQRQLQILREKAAEDSRRVHMLENTELESPVPTLVLPTPLAASEPGHPGATHTTLATASNVNRRSDASVVPEVTQMWLDTPLYTLERSVWDLSLLSWTSELGPLPSLFSMVLLLATLALQVSFCGLLVRNFAEPEVDEDTAGHMQNWREHAGHRFDWIDPGTQMSLAAKMCQDDTRTTVQVSGAQVFLYDAVLDFMGDDEGWKAMFNGNKMVLLALGFYYMSVCRELNDIHRLFCGLWRLPRGGEDEGKPTSFLLTRIDMRWVSISHARFSACVVLLGVRLFIMLILTFSGTVWLVYEMDVKDLLLKAAALEFILRTDEVVFLALAPEAGRRFIDRLKPLPFQPSRSLGGVGLKLVMLISAVSIFMLAAYYTWVNETLWPYLEDTKEAMCQLNLDFVYAAAPNALGLVALASTAQSPSSGVSPSDPSDRSVADYSRALELHMYRLAVNNDLSSPISAADGLHVIPLSEMPSWELQTMSSMLLELQSSTCQDHILDSGLVAQVRFLLQEHFLSDARGDDDAQQSLCAPLAMYCSHGEGLAGTEKQRLWGQLVRHLCPATCGCNAVSTGVPFSSGHDSGCAATCEDAWLTELASSACNDRSVSQLASSQLWVDTASRAERIMVAEGHPGTWRQTLITGGCAAIPSSSSSDAASVALRSMLCARGFGLKPVSALCPEACGCIDTHGAADCPTSCSARHCTDRGWQYWPVYFGSAGATGESFRNPCAASTGLTLPCCELCIDDCASPAMSTKMVWDHFSGGFSPTCRTGQATEGMCMSGGAVESLGRIAGYTGDGVQQCSFECRARWMATFAQPRLCQWSFMDSISPLVVETGWSVNPVCDAWLYFHSCTTLWSSICPDSAHPMGNGVTVKDFCPQDCP